MAYKYSVGERKFGDIKAQSDAEGDTLIDFDEDFIDLKTAGQSRIKISGSQGNITFNDSFTFPTTDGNTNQVLTTDGNGNLSFQAPATGSGANPPGGSDRQVQFNDNGSFAGNSGILVDEDFNLKVSGSLIGRESIGVGMELGGGRNTSNQWVSVNVPQHKFHVVGDIHESATFSVDTAADSIGGSSWVFTKARGTPANPTGVQTNDEIGRIQFFAHTGSSTLKSSALILASADSDGDGRLRFYITKEGEVDNIAIECYNNQVKIQDQMVIGAAGIIPISNGGASIGGSTYRFDYIRGNNIVAYESLSLGATHPVYDKGAFGVSINKDHLPIGNYTSGEGLTYVSNNANVENVILALHKTGSHFGGMAVNGSVTDGDQKVVFFSQYNTAGFEWRNNIPSFGTNGMGNLTTKGNILMQLNSNGLLTIGDITLPKTDGTSGQVLKTDGAGNVSWQDESSGVSGGASSDSQTQIITGSTGTVTHDCTNSKTFYHTNISGNFVVNLTNLNLSSGYKTEVTLMLEQSGSGFLPNGVEISGVEQSLYWEGAVYPRPSDSYIDIARMTITNTGGSYSVLGKYEKYNLLAISEPVTSGSILLLDASDPSSYGGTGATWNDLSGEGNSATLVNSPSYSSTTKLFSFNGSNEYASLPSGFANFTNGITLFFVADLASTSNSYERLIDLSNGADVDNILFSRETTTTGLRYDIRDGTNGNTNVVASNGVLNNTLASYAAVDDGTNVKLYRNGILLSTGASNIPANVTRGTNYIAKSPWNDGYLEGSIGVAIVYDRPLSEEEISQNHSYYSQLYSL